MNNQQQYNGVYVGHPDDPIFPHGLGLNAAPKQDRQQTPTNIGKDVRGISKRDLELAALNSKSTKTKTGHYYHEYYKMTLK